MIEKKFETVMLNNGKKKLTIVFLDKKYALLSTLFFVEIGAFENWIKENITAVLQGEAEEKNISGNICEIVIQKKNTTIYDMLADDGMGNWCSVPTREFLSLIDEWHEQKALLEQS